MQRTISAMVGKGSQNHNSRQFTASNVDASRTYLNKSYVNEDLKTVYHQLFDESLEKYNAKQKRNDRKIPDYYDKIAHSKQEKLFHELILQIGDKDDMNAQSEDGKLAMKILDKYFQDFQKRNPNLYVFSAHLHMDEATPHLHIDFVPFTTNSKQGLETRVSLKQALAAQGFKGGSRSETEWNQWVQSEKEQLAVVMEKHGIDWKHKGTHEKHLSVLDYEKKMRTEEVEKLTDEVEVARDQLEAYRSGAVLLAETEQRLQQSPEMQIPEPQSFMTAKAYKTKIIEPFVAKLKNLVMEFAHRYFTVLGENYSLRNELSEIKRDYRSLRKDYDKVYNERSEYRKELIIYNRRKKIFGKDFLTEMFKQRSKSKGEREK